MDASALYPAILLALGLLGVLGVDLGTRGRRPGALVGIAVAALLAAGIAALTATPRDAVALGVLRGDAFGIALTVFCCATGAVSILATTRGEALRTPSGEFLALMLTAVLGMSVLVMSVDLVALYLAFETVSIPSYVLVCMRRTDVRATEAGLKYVLFGAVSSALMLYGLSLLVGLAGGTALADLSGAIREGAASQPAFLVASALVFAGFAFKISAVPFHFWAPDVYAGAPASVAGFLAVASKAAGFAALIRVVGATVVDAVPSAADPLHALLPGGNPLFAILALAAVFTMSCGNLAALRQREIKRLLAWSSIAHAGYLLLALSVWSQDALAAVLLYLVAYLFMNLAAFLLAGILIRDLGTGEIAAFRGLGRRHVGLALAFAVVLFSLTGLPPFFGFVAKLQVFTAVFDRGYVWLGVIGLLNGVVSLTYYARVLAVLFLQDERVGEPPARARLALPDRLLCALLVLPLLLFGVWWSGLWSWAREAVPFVLEGR